jgi:hypothetical protein
LELSHCQQKTHKAREVPLEEGGEGEVYPGAEGKGAVQEEGGEGVEKSVEVIELL